jgi:hypothetical protein
VMHIVFGLFVALTIVCTLRGLSLYAQAWSNNRAHSNVIAAQSPAVIEEA